MRNCCHYGQARGHCDHKPWRLAKIKRERFRGAIRGAAVRERRLYPSPAKSQQRKIRQRLVGAYIRRFGLDEFAVSFSRDRMELPAQSNWLPNGYAWWRERRQRSSV